MKPNFDISLPSIPGKSIKFKIQDIKQTSFGAQKVRFNDDKRGLTKKFIESFNNFHESKDQSRFEEQTQASQSGSRISVGSSVQTRQKPEIRFRHIIPEERKHLMSVYEHFKDHQPEIINQNKFDKGHTFNRAQNEVLNVKKQESSEEQNFFTRKFVTDNYYFTSTVLKPVDTGQGNFDESDYLNAKNGQKKREKPSANFRNQERQRVWGRAYKSEVPGPGFYVIKQQPERKARTKKTPSMKQSSGSQNNYKKLKNIITSIVGQEKQISQQAPLNEDSKKQKLQYIFIQDDRDRFGEQKYPISSKVNVPGPGSYDVMHGIQEQANKIALVEQQRKLLKQWFNN